MRALTAIAILGSCAVSYAAGWGLASLDADKHIERERATARNLIKSADITDVVARLRPFVKGPDRPESYYNGLLITFIGAASVEVKMKLLNGDEHSLRAPTLREALRRLTTPSDEIKKALEGWH